MALRNKALLRKPHAMLRINAEEEADFEFLVDYYGGGEPAAIYREALKELARAKRHERNSLAPSRLDRTGFGHLFAA